MALRLRRGTDAERLLITPVEGELIYTTDTKLLYAGDGTTAGGTLVTGSGGGGGSTTLDALTDTDLTGAADNDVLTYNSGTSKWESVAVPGVGVLSLNDLSDVFMPSTPSSNDILRFDGVNFTAEPVSEIFNEQQNYKINIVGDDSTIIINTDNNNVTGNFFGDLTGNVTGNTAGAHTGTFDGDMTGSVFGDDSTIIIDGLNNSGHFNSIISTDAQLSVGRATGITEFRLESFQTRNRLNINTVDKTGDLSSYTGYYGTLNFGFQDATTDRSDCTIRGRASDMRIAHDTVTDFISDETKYFTLKEGNFGFGTYSPAEKLDVRGNIVATGTIQPGVYADNTARDAAIPSPTAGMMVFNTTGTKFQGYTGSAWVDLN